LVHRFFKHLYFSLDKWLNVIGIQLEYCYYLVVAAWYILKKGADYITYNVLVRIVIVVVN